MRLLKLNGTLLCPRTLQTSVLYQSKMVERILAHTGRNGYFVLDLQTGATISTFKVCNILSWRDAFQSTQGCSGRKYSSAFIGASPLSSHLSINSSYFAVADAHRSFVHVFRTDKANAPCHSHAVPERLHAICFSSCGSICIAGGDTGNIYVWDTSTGALLRFVWFSIYNLDDVLHQMLERSL